MNFTDVTVEFDNDIEFGVNQAFGKTYITDRRKMILALLI